MTRCPLCSSTAVGTIKKEVRARNVIPTQDPLAYPVRRRCAECYYKWSDLGKDPILVQYEEMRENDP